MTDKSMPNSSNTVRRLNASNGQNTLRAFTFSPDSIALQIRCEKWYATAILTDAQARLLVQIINDAIAGHT